MLVGLGNPTARYEKTRHNAGFWFVDRAAQEWRVILRNETRFQGALGRCDAKPGSPLFFFKPMIYMNRSGQAVSAVANYYKLAPAEILVIHDDLDLPPGSVRLKKGGGHGGHNGIRDTAGQLGTPDFYRLRLGIGHPGERSAVVNYVLDAPSKEEACLIDAAMIQALSELDAIVRGDYAPVMNRLHAAAAVTTKNT